MLVLGHVSREGAMLCAMHAMGRVLHKGAVPCHVCDGPRMEWGAFCVIV